MAKIDLVRHDRAQVRAADIDEGLRGYMNKVYGLMSAALLVTFVLAYTISTSVSALNLIFGTPLFYLVVFGPLAVVLVANFAFERLSVFAINAIFWTYAGLIGASFASIFVMFDMAQIITGLLYTAVAFLGLSLTGYVTKRDLSGVHQVAIMMAWGLVALAIGSFLFGGFGGIFTTLFNVAILGVFAVLTATSTQQIKNTYLEARAHGGPQAELFLEKASIMGALQLYISFIAMFQSIMYLFMGSND